MNGPLDRTQMINLLLYIRWRAEGRIPVNPRCEDLLAGRPFREDDGVFVRVTRVADRVAFQATPDHS